MGTRRRGGFLGGLIGALILLVSVGGAAWYWLGWTVDRQKAHIAALESARDRLMSGTVPLRFMVLSRGGGEIRARVRLYDADGSEVAVAEERLPGEELYIDFILVPLADARGPRDPAAASGEAWAAFPSRLFTDRLPAAEGPSLFGHYDRSGFPAILAAKSQRSDERKLLTRLFAEARRLASGEGSPGSEGFGSAVHELASMARFETGVVYRVVSRPKGGIEIMEDRP